MCVCVCISLPHSLLRDKETLDAWTVTGNRNWMKLIFENQKTVNEGGEKHGKETSRTTTRQVDATLLQQGVELVWFGMPPATTTTTGESVFLLKINTRLTRLPPTSTCSTWWIALVVIVTGTNTVRPVFSLFPSNVNCFTSHGRKILHLLTVKQGDNNNNRNSC